MAGPPPPPGTPPVQPPRPQFGRLSSRTYQTQSGETRHSNDINITEVQFLGQRSDRIEDVVVAPEEYQEAEADLPF